MNAVSCFRRIIIQLAGVLWATVYSLSSICLAQPQEFLPELVRRIKPSAVAIETFDTRGEKVSRGSGSSLIQIAS